MHHRSTHRELSNGTKSPQYEAHGTKTSTMAGEKNDLGDFNVPKTEETKNLRLLIDFPYT